MKRIFTLLSVLVCGLAVNAQSININHAGIQSSFDAMEIEDVTFVTAETGNQVNVNKVGASALAIDPADMTSMTFSEGPADHVRKHADGGPAQVLFSCLEVNNTNPLQTQNYRLKKANKYLFDAVILFSSNINYSKKEDVVYIHNNENVQPILNNYEHYIKPLQDKGIKVLLSLLGNHDGSGLANLGPERSKAFAQAIADTLNKYNLDGVFFDDEYSEYNKNLYATYTGFETSASYESASRLAYDVKQAIGDKWVVLYKYGNYYYGKPVDGVNPGAYLDYVLSNYGEAAADTKSFADIDPSQVGGFSYNYGGYNSKNNLKKVRSGKHGAFMVYNLDQEKYDFDYNGVDMLFNIGYYLFDDEVEVTKTHYTKDWKTIDELKEPNR